MNTRVEITLLDSGSESWDTQIDQLRTLLGAPDNATLLPPHYLKATFPKIGGRIVAFRKEQTLAGAGFLFPRALGQNGREFTLRFHRLDPNLDLQPLVPAIEEKLGDVQVVFYDPQADQPYYEKTSQESTDLAVGPANGADALAIRNLQQRVWGSEPDYLYPADIHSTRFRTGSSLIAKLDGEPVAFLFGFYTFDGPRLPAEWSRKYRGEFRIESQLLGALPEFRGRNIGSILKKAQAENARREGIGIIHWTVDPLQYRNARLNFGQLRTLSFGFYPNYYSFRNELNQTPASRLVITWLINTTWVQQGPEGGQTIQDLSGNISTLRFEKKWPEAQLAEQPRSMAIEIPAHWTALQKDHPEQAARWRTSTDRLFQHYLGCEEGHYIITGVGEDGEQKYLIADRVDAELLEKLGRSA